jgi:hypothetical protein
MTMARAHLVATSRRSPPRESACEKSPHATYVLNQVCNPCPDCARRPSTFNCLLSTFCFALLAKPAHRHRVWPGSLAKSATSAHVRNACPIFSTSPSLRDHPCSDSTLQDRVERMAIRSKTGQEKLAPAAQSGHYASHQPCVVDRNVPFTLVE